MSLLDRGDIYESCNIYPEVRATDVDGNIVTRASSTPIPTVGYFQIQNQSGTSSRREETDTEGYETEQVYLLRLPRSFTEQHGILGAQSKVGWGVDSMGRERMFSFFGDAILYAGTGRSRHITYTLRRA